MNSQNTKFYILIVCSIVIYITSLLSASNSSTPSTALAIILLVITAKKSKDSTITKTSQFLLGIMSAILVYRIYIYNF